MRREAVAGSSAVAALMSLTTFATPVPAVASSPATSPSSIAAARLAKMSEAQRVGQLFMVGGVATGVSSATLNAISRYHVGNVILTGRSTAGRTSVQHVTASLRARVSAASTDSVPLFIATDQEGGYVQVLKGSGFSTMPTALTQGGWSSSREQSSATTWGRQLHAAGVNVDLAPVADTVPSAAFAPKNAPIGHYKREFGYTTSRVGAHTVAFARGLAAAHVAATAKHFPGLGRVTANPDTATHVTDRTTTRHDAYLAPFAAAVKVGVPFVMVSTAFYSRIDASRPAAFSPVVIGQILRGDLGFKGVVISDDLGQAKQVSSWSLAARAVDFVNAGGDMVLTVVPSTIPTMYGAMLDRARSNSAFRKKVDAAALAVLTAKAQLGLIH